MGAGSSVASELVSYNLPFNRLEVLVCLRKVLVEGGATVGINVKQYCMLLTTSWGMVLNVTYILTWNHGSHESCVNFPLGWVSYVLC